MLGFIDRERCAFPQLRRWPTLDPVTYRIQIQIQGLTDNIFRLKGHGILLFVYNNVITERQCVFLQIHQAWNIIQHVRMLLKQTLFFFPGGKNEVVTTF